MLKFNDTVGVIPILQELRTVIDWGMDPALVTEIFDYFTRSINRSKQMKDLWLRAVQQVTKSEGHNVVDFIILIVIAASFGDYAITVESIVKRRIKSGLLTIGLLQKSFRQLGYMLVNNISACLDLFENLFRDRSRDVALYGSECFKQLLQINDDAFFDKHLVITQVISLACMKSVEMPFIDQSLRTDTLLLLNEVQRKFKNEMRTAFYHVEKILDFGKELTLFQFRLTIDILANLAFEPPGDEVLKDHLELLVRKQITNTISPSHQKQAIVTLARMLFHLLWADHNSAGYLDSLDSESTLNSVSQIPTSGGRDMARLIALAMDAIDETSILLMLLYDEVAAVLLDKNRPMSLQPDKGLMLWMSDHMQITFQDKFMVETSPERIMDMDVEYVFCINRPEENENNESDVLNLGVNLADATLCDERTNVLFSHFNLLRALQVRRYGRNLEVINALLGE